MQNMVQLDNAGGLTAITTVLIQPGSRIYLVIVLPICTFVLGILYHKLGIKQNIKYRLDRFFRGDMPANYVTAICWHIPSKKPILTLSISIAAHWDTGVALRHALHSRHARHTRHILYRRSASKIGCAIGTEGPTEFQQTFALGTRAFHLLTARGANLEIRLYTRMAIVACLTLGHLGQQRFLFQLALVNLSERLAGSQNHVDEETAYEEDCY